MLLELDPETRQVTCLVDGLWFGNGVALPRDGSFVLFVDTMRLAVYKLWLSGPKVNIRSLLAFFSVSLA
jgi:sugar lactone lactonase YvrE